MAFDSANMNGRRTEEVYRNIYRIPVPLPENPLKELNSYLIRDPKRSLLIDTGFCHSACRDALLAGLSELGEDPGDVDILLTHLHADHSGMSSEIIGPGRQILISEIDGNWLMKLPPAGEKRSGEGWVWSMESDILSGMPPEIVNNMEDLNPALKFSTPGGVSYTCIKDGEILSIGGYSFRCILTPGHSPGHLCLWDENHSLMFTGDHVLYDITPNITVWPGVEDSLGDYLQSLNMIRRYPVKDSLPGHRKPGDFHARIDELLEHHGIRLAEVEKIIGAQPGLTAYEIAGIMRWKIRAQSWDDFPASQKIFAVGECQSHLDYLRKRDVIFREREGSVHRYYLRRR